MRTKELGRLGREVGSITSLSTVGSVIGALAAGFYLIPTLSISTILLGSAVVLLALAAGCFYATATNKGHVLAGLCIALAVGAVIINAASAAPEETNLRHHESSFYGEIKVVDLAPPADKRILYLDGMPHTIAKLSTLESVSDYFKGFELGCYIRPKAKLSLLLGLGGGIFVGHLKTHCGMVTDVLDIDEKLVAVAKTWFNFKPTGEVILQDGRAYLEQTKKTYDIIFMDTYSGEQLPYHMLSLESFKAARKRLKEDGLLMLNVIGYAKGPKAGLRRAVEKTLRETFSHVKVFWSSSKRDPNVAYTNLVFMASDASLEFRKNPMQGRPEIVEYLNSEARFLKGDDAGILITDNFNPVETLGVAASLEIRKKLIKHASHMLVY